MGCQRRGARFLFVSRSRLLDHQDTRGLPNELSLPGCQDVYGHEYTMLEISYIVTAFELISSIVFVVAIIIWRRWTDIAVRKVRIVLSRQDGSQTRKSRQ